MRVRGIDGQWWEPGPCPHCNPNGRGAEPGICHQGGGAIAAAEGWPCDECFRFDGRGLDRDARAKIQVVLETFGGRITPPVLCSFCKGRGKLHLPPKESPLWGRGVF
jgi:hypothetical protein